MTQTNNQPVTNEELARMIAKGFAETATKADISGLEERINGLDDRLTSVEGSLTKIDDRFNHC